MTCKRSGPRAVHALIALFIAVLAAAFVAPISTAGAAGTHRAGVIVDTGGEVHRTVITFSEDSISGVQALQRAGASPVLKGYALGAAVCSLYGVGHDVDSCLGAGSDARYWGYWHVPQGQTGFTQATFSGAGAGSVQVHDGDIEGWRFGNGVSQPPPFATIDQIDPPPSPPPPTSPPPTAPPATAGEATSQGGSGAGMGGTTGEMGLPATGSTGTKIAPTAAEAAAAAAAAAAEAGAGGSSTSSANRKGMATEVAAERASATRGAGDEGGSPVASIVGFAAVLAVLGAGIFFARRARVGRSAGGS